MGKAKYTKNKLGYYQARIWDGTYNKDGTKHRKNIYSSKSSKDLEEKVAAFQEQVKKGNVQISTDINFFDYARNWLKTTKNVREKNTQLMYWYKIEKYVSSLEDIKLTDLRHSHIQEIINENVDKPRTCELILLTVKQILKLAIKNSYITHEKYEKITSDLAIPKYKAPEKRALTPTEKEALKKASFTDRERVYIALLYSCGLRRGEALALTPSDFTFGPEGSTVSINKTIIFNGNNPEIKNCPKSDNGFRRVPIPDETALYLKQYINSLDRPYLIENTTNKSLITASGYRRMWENIVTKMNYAAGGSDTEPKITDLTAHIFRHNYCTNLCYNIPNISIKKIAALMGDTEKMVMDVYNHIIEEQEDVQGIINKTLSM